jgi:hypothetical protein
MTKRTKDGDLAPVGDLIEQLMFDEPELAIHPEQLTVKTSKLANKRVDAIMRVRAHRDEAQQQIGYLAKPFLLLGLPFKPVKGTAHYKRTNLDEVLEITGSTDYGLPFGEDILVLIWVSTLAVLGMKDGVVPRVIEFRRAAEMLKAFGLPLDGKTYRRMQERFLRVFYATFFYGRKNSMGRAKLYSVRFFDSVDLWFTRDLQTDILPGEEFMNRIVLSEAFARDLEEHRPPIDLEAVKLWANSPGQLYFYLWLVYRCWVARTESKISLMAIKEQCGVQGYTGVEGARNFRRKVRGWLAGVKTAWPDCPVTLGSDARGDVLTIRPNRTAIRGRGV